MDTLQLSLSEAFFELFGYESQAFDPILPTDGDNPKSRVLMGMYGSPYYANDPVSGREYFLPISITYPDNSGMTNQPTGMTVQSLGSAVQVGQPTGAQKTYTLPGTVISFATRKTVVETPMTERSGMVAELININGVDITIRGVIWAQMTSNAPFPEQDLFTLNELYRQNVAVNIQSVITDIILQNPEQGGVDMVTIREFRMLEGKGSKHVRGYEMVLRNDVNFNLNDIS